MHFLRIAALATLMAGTANSAWAEPISVALDWAPNTNHIGLYVAQAQGLYEDAGIEIDILPAGTEADISVFGVLDFYTMKAGGLDAVGIYAVIQTETGRLAYNGDIAARPRDLADGVYGGFGTTWEQAIVDTMIAHDGGEPDYETVTLNTTVYDALRSGEVDFTLEVRTWQGVENELAGNSVDTFAYADYGVPDQHTIMFGAQADLIAADPDLVAAFVAATQAGYAYAIAHPDEAADMLIAAAPELADQRDLVEASMATMIEDHFLAREDGTIGLFDEDKMLELGAFLFEAEALVDADGAPLGEAPDFSTYFTNQFIE